MLSPDGVTIPSMSTMICINQRMFSQASFLKRGSVARLCGGWLVPEIFLSLLFQLQEMETPHNAELRQLLVNTSLKAIKQPHPNGVILLKSTTTVEAALQVC